MYQVRCTQCGVEKPETAEHFAARSAKRNGLASQCRECDRARSRERQRRRLADPVERAKLLDEKRRYSESERGRRAKRLASFIDNHKRRHPVFEWSREAWDAAVSFWGGCAYCGRVTDTLEHDHVVAVTEDDSPGTVPWNIVPACRFCSRSKGARRLTEWAAPAIVERVLAYLEAQR